MLPYDSRLFPRQILKLFLVVSISFKQLPLSYFTTPWPVNHFHQCSVLISCTFVLSEKIDTYLLTYLLLLEQGVQSLFRADDYRQQGGN